MNRVETIPQSEWTSCPHCNLKHRQRSDGQCPRCKQVGFAALPDVYDGRALPGSRLEREIAHPEAEPDSPWKTLVSGLFLVGVAILLHQTFAELESGARESVRVWWVIAVLYYTVGPGITVALVGLFGGIATLAGLRRLLS